MIVVSLWVGMMGVSALVVALNENAALSNRIIAPMRPREARDVSTQSQTTYVQAPFPLSHMNAFIVPCFHAASMSLRAFMHVRSRIRAVQSVILVIMMGVAGPFHVL